MDAQCVKFMNEFSNIERKIWAGDGPQDDKTAKELVAVIK